MSTPEQPETPPLTRRQLRELRNTGATPVVAAPAPEAAPSVEESPAEPVVPSPPAHLARPAQPVSIPEPPTPDASVDLGVSPLTRRQARQQERIRTASVPVITPEILAAHAAEHVTEPALEAEPTTEAAVESDAPHEPEVAETGDESSAETDAAADAADAEAEERAVVSPQLGAELLESEPAPVALPPSFDQLISRSSSGSTATPNALIMSPGSESSNLVAPVTATGEVLITGSLNLPEGLGSLGHAPGTADGKDVDAVLVDGELPAHSSPTPIAASAAISTAKTSGDIIKPPAPEKGSKLMVTLAITAGVLAAALLGVLAVAIITGVF